MQQIPDWWGIVPREMDIVDTLTRVLDRNTLFEKEYYKINLKIKLMLKVVRNVVVHEIIKLPNVVVHDNGDCNLIIPHMSSL